MEGGTGNQSDFGSSREHYYWSSKPESRWTIKQLSGEKNKTQVGARVIQSDFKTQQVKMLKVSNVGRGRTNSFSLLEPSTPNPTPSSSYIPDSLLENRMMVGLDSSELVRAAERFLLQPTKTEAKDAKEAARLRSVQEMCEQFLLTDEQLQHIEERMVMEVEQ